MTLRTLFHESNEIDTDSFVTLAAFDLKLLGHFYSQLLGTPTSQISNVYAFQLPGLRLGIFQPKESNLQFESAKSRISLCLEVTDLEDAIAHLTTLGYPPPGKIITASHDREIYAYDPEGNRLILHQRNG